MDDKHGIQWHDAATRVIPTVKSTENTATESPLPATSRALVLESRDQGMVAWWAPLGSDPELANDEKIAYKTIKSANKICRG